MRINAQFFNGPLHNQFRVMEHAYREYRVPMQNGSRFDPLDVVPVAVIRHGLYRLYQTAQGRYVYYYVK